MRPRSMVGPLLLIGLGSLLLLHTLRPQPGLLAIFGRYWPFILIGWGLVRLLEIVYWRIRRFPLPAYGISGAEWTAIILICLAGSALHAVERYRPWDRLGAVASRRLELFGRSYEYTIAEQRLPAPTAARLLVENLRGTTRITGAETQEIRVSGRKTLRAVHDAEASQADRNTPVELSRDADRVVLRTNLDRVASDLAASAHIEVVVPRGTAVEVRSRNADLEASSLASLEFSSESGSARARNISGPVRFILGRAALISLVEATGPVEIAVRRGRDLEVEAVKGAVTLEGYYSGDLRLASLGGPLRFQNVQTTLKLQKLPGRIQMDLGDLTGVRLEGPVHFSSSRACDVQLDEFAQGAEISVDSGDIRLRPAPSALGPIHARTRSGDIELALPEQAAFQLRARTARGTIFNHFGPLLRETSEGERASVLTGGTTGHPMHLETMRGSITVRKDTVAPPSRSADRSPRQIEIGARKGTPRAQHHRVRYAHDGTVAGILISMRRRTSLPPPQPWANAGQRPPWL
ncbi:MAG: DUF4097 domain-containing protein [Bryobacteraceae bacterium]|nr:DUF4097 domain-containing protein [Bryobacteraceae bacterium]